MAPPSSKLHSLNGTGRGGDSVEVTDCIKDRRCYLSKGNHTARYVILLRGKKDRRNR